VSAAKQSSEETILRAHSQKRSFILRAPPGYPGLRFAPATALGTRCSGKIRFCGSGLHSFLCPSRRGCCRTPPIPCANIHAIPRRPIISIIAVTSRYQYAGKAHYPPLLPTASPFLVQTKNPRGRKHGRRPPLSAVPRRFPRYSAPAASFSSAASADA
jgi:hypothetical protein